MTRFFPEPEEKNNVDKNIRIFSKRCKNIFVPLFYIIKIASNTFSSSPDRWRNYRYQFVVKKKDRKNSILSGYVRSRISRISREKEEIIRVMVIEKETQIGGERIEDKEIDQGWFFYHFDIPRSRYILARDAWKSQTGSYIYGPDSLSLSFLNHGEYINLLWEN